MESKWNNFTLKELTCQCGCGRMEMNEIFMGKLVLMREYLDFPLPLTSAYRCPKHNNDQSKTGFTGPHTTGRSADIQIYGYRAHQLIALVGDCGFTGIGIKQHGPHDKRFIRVDDLPQQNGQPRPWIWSY